MDEAVSDAVAGKIRTCLTERDVCTEADFYCRRMCHHGNLKHHFTRVEARAIRIIQEGSVDSARTKGITAPPVGCVWSPRGDKCHGHLMSEE